MPVVKTRRVCLSLSSNSGRKRESKLNNQRTNKRISWMGDRVERIRTCRARPATAKQKQRTSVCINRQKWRLVFSFFSEPKESQKRRNCRLARRVAKQRRDKKHTKNKNKNQIIKKANLFWRVIRLLAVGERSAYRSDGSNCFSPPWRNITRPVEL
jgi:hypothetical protein